MYSLVYAMYVIVILTFVVALRLLWVRVRALQGGKIRMSYFRNLPEDQTNEQMMAAARHFVNLFEVPVLFFAVCILSLVLNVQSESLVIAAWFFVIARILQSIIHLTYNNVRHRFFVFMSGYIAVLFMWTTLVLY